MPRVSVFAQPPSRKPRPVLTRDAIVARAIVILDADGADGLTFRRLAAELDVGLASLHWHVPSREALLDLALDTVAGELWATLSRDSKQASPDWLGELREVATTLYVGLSSRPWAGRQQLVSRDPGPNQLRIWDRLGRIVLAAGLDEERSFFAMTAILSYLLGYVGQETAPLRSSADRPGNLESMGALMSSLDPAEFPAVHQLVGTFLAHTQQAQFDAGLDLLLAGLAQQVATG
jgi:AcrR family transcriptional regulator